MTLGLLFIIVLSLYFISILTGWVLGKKGVLDIAWFIKTKRSFADPLTVKIHQWLDKYKTGSIKNKKWFRFYLLIFLNNLVLVAFISRTIYGILFIIPIYFTIRQGLSHGILFSNPIFSKPGLKSALMAIFEFGGYIFATVGGVNLGLSFFINSPNIVSSFVTALKDLIYIYPVVVLFLTIGAYLETSFIKTGMSAVKIDPNFDMEKAREVALKMLQNKKE